MIKFKQTTLCLCVCVWVSECHKRKFQDNGKTLEYETGKQEKNRKNFVVLLLPLEYHFKKYNNFVRMLSGGVKARRLFPTFSSFVHEKGKFSTRNDNKKIYNEFKEGNYFLWTSWKSSFVSCVFLLLLSLLFSYCSDLVRNGCWEKRLSSSNL